MVALKCTETMSWLCIGVAGMPIAYSFMYMLLEKGVVVVIDIESVYFLGNQEGPDWGLNPGHLAW